MKFHYEQVLNASDESFATEKRSGSVIDCVFHVHPEYELTWIVESHGTRFVGDTIEPFLPGDLTLIGGMIPHHYLTDIRDSSGPGWVKWKVVKFSPALIESFGNLPEFSQMKRMLARAARGLSFSPGTVSQATIELNQLFDSSGYGRLLLLLRMLNLLAEGEFREISSVGGEELDQPDERLGSVLAFIHRRLEEGRQVTLAEAAAKACLTPSAFSHYFRRATRRNFIEYITELKLSRAAQLLAGSNRTVAEIAFAAGFSNLSNFNRHFRNKKGMTPRAYRNLYRFR